MITPEEFYKDTIGKKIDCDGAYGNQCVDLFIYYCKKHNIPYVNTVTGWAGGLWTHRKDYYKRYFDLIYNFNDVKTGDWVFTQNPQHVYMYYNGKMLGQNQGGNLEPVDLRPISGQFLGAYRPKDSGSRFLAEVTCDVLRVRARPTINSSIVTRVYNGEVFTILETAKADGYTWGRLKSGIGWIALDYTKKL